MHCSCLEGHSEREGRADWDRGAIPDRNDLIPKYRPNYVQPDPADDAVPSEMQRCSDARDRPIKDSVSRFAPESGTPPLRAPLAFINPTRGTLLNKLPNFKSVRVGTVLATEYLY